MTDERKKRISEGVKRYYQSETPYKRNLRIENLTLRKMIEKKLYCKFGDLYEKDFNFRRYVDSV